MYLLGFFIGLYLFYLAIAADFNGLVRLCLGATGLLLIAAFIRSVWLEDK